MAEEISKSYRESYPQLERMEGWVRECEGPSGWTWSSPLNPDISVRESYMGCNSVLWGTN